MTLELVHDTDGPRSVVDDAERAVLGALLLYPESMPDVATELAPDDFSDPRHVVIYRAMGELDRAGRGLDLLTLTQAIPERDLPFIGHDYLTAIDANVPVSNNVMRYVEIVRDASTRRKLRRAGLALASDAGNSNVKTSDAIAIATRSLSDAEGHVVVGNTLVAEQMRPIWDAMQRRYENPGITGLPTGLRTLDNFTLGFGVGDLVIVGGVSSSGKTSISTQACVHVATMERKPVAFFSVEMGAQQIIERMLYTEARVDSHRARTGHFLESDWPKLGRAATLICGDSTTPKPPLHVVDCAGRGLDFIRATSRRLHRTTGGLALIAVDYLQIVAVRPGLDRAEGVAEVSRGLKMLARELGCVVIAVAQLNREVAKRTDKRPMMSDLKETSSIEQDADTIIFVYRDEMYDPDTQDKGVSEAIVAKQRNGPTGTVRLRFEKEFTRFADLEER